MLYFKNTELAEKYHISEGTVRNWIKSAEDKKLDLTLTRVGEKNYVANTAGNLEVIKKLIEERRKYRNARSVKVVKPSPQFYELYNESQIYDIVRNLEIYHEIPRQYNYFDGGASSWDEYTQRLAGEDTPNLIKGTIELIERNLNSIDIFLAKYDRINIVDIGVGNAMPVKGLISHLLDRGKLGRYIALDISPEILRIAQKNIRDWFSGRVSFEAYESDISYERFTNILAEEYIGEGSEKVANLVLLLGGTLSNLRSPDGAFRVIHDSMGRKDFMIFTTKLDTEISRRYFDFNVNPGESEIPPIHRLLVDLLNIDKAYYLYELGYDERSSQRYERIRFKVALTIQFEFEAGGHEVTFNKGDALLIWRYWQQGAMEIGQQFDNNGFYVLHSNQTEDEGYLLSISRVKSS